MRLLTLCLCLFAATASRAFEQFETASVVGRVHDESGAAAFGAEYGRSSGGQVNVVTRSGTNQLHTAAWEFLRKKAFDAKPFNLTSLDLPQFQRNQFGGTIGAPLVTDRLFVFGAYEGLRLNQAAASLTTVRVPTRSTTIFRG